MNVYFAIKGLVDTDNLPHVKGNGNDNSALMLGLNIAFAIIGATAFLLIVIAGTRYVFARDNPESITKARNSIVYAAIGLVIVASAAVIVNLIIGRLGK